MDTRERQERHKCYRKARVVSPLVKQRRMLSRDMLIYVLRARTPLQVAAAHRPPCYYTLFRLRAESCFRQQATSPSCLQSRRLKFRRATFAFSTLSPRAFTGSREGITLYARSMPLPAVPADMPRCRPPQTSERLEDSDIYARMRNTRGFRPRCCSREFTSLSSTELPFFTSQMARPGADIAMLFSRTPTV